MSRRRVVITGMGVITSLGETVDELWENLFVHEVAHFLGAVVGQHDVAPIGATFEDGYKAAVVCDAILESAKNGVRIPIAQLMD